MLYGFDLRGAVAAAGCSHHGSGLIPSTPGGAVPGADAIAGAYPATPLPKAPILGEVRRFDGAVAPPNWAMCDGSMIRASTNPTLAKVLGQTKSGDIHLPKATSKFGLVVAVSGEFPRSPAELAAFYQKRSASV